MPQISNFISVIIFCLYSSSNTLRTVPTNGKYFFPDNDYVRQVDHISGYQNPKIV